jgi:hypothetical protein
LNGIWGFRSDNHALEYSNNTPRLLLVRDRQACRVQAAVFPSEEHLQVLQSFLKVEPGTQVSVGWEASKYIKTTFHHPSTIA